MPTVIAIAHILFAVFASWRLTEVITMDRISEPIRRRWPLYIWTCPRCVSVWASAFCAVAFYISPWINWPLGMAWMYVAHIEWVVRERQATERPRLIIEAAESGELRIIRSDFNSANLKEIAGRLDALSSTMPGNA